jgi:hypothetical protein
MLGFGPYWSIGRDLSQRFTSEGWGTKINDRLASDLQAEFPGVESFSPRNLLLELGRGFSFVGSQASAAPAASFKRATRHFAPGLSAIKKLRDGIHRNRVRSTFSGSARR